MNIRTETQEYIVLDTLKFMESQLPESSFARIHKSFIVNLDRIKSIGSRNVTLLSDQEIPVGESYRTGFLQRLK
ncbi:LytR/AlgR family response regulator transcription factor [uncultured Chryseobacterium sp.]|uniref:LytR/AlgR family response regulator transcription factor n=1 Tax=uncultured Chryseobacterium sp. TaxID=259322 RepID=UPI0037486F99